MFEFIPFSNSKKPKNERKKDQRTKAKGQRAKKRACEICLSQAGAFQQHHSEGVSAKEDSAFCWFALPSSPIELTEAKSTLTNYFKESTVIVDKCTKTEISTDVKKKNTATNL